MSPRKSWGGRKGTDRLECPFCHATGNDVTNSRPSDDRSRILRRRECRACLGRFTTVEHVLPQRVEAKIL